MFINYLIGSMILEDCMNILWNQIIRQNHQVKCLFMCILSYLYPSIQDDPCPYSYTFKFSTRVKCLLYSFCIISLPCTLFSKSNPCQWKVFPILWSFSFTRALPCSALISIIRRYLMDPKIAVFTELSLYIQNTCCDYLKWEYIE